MKLPVGHVPGQGVHKATAYGGFGQRMLEKMGWEKGLGLGKNKSGMKDAIEVKKKEDTLGVGATPSGWNWDWKYWEDAYNGAVDKVGKHGEGSSDSGTTSSSSSDSDTSSGSSSGSSGDEDDPALGRIAAAATASLGAASGAVHRDGTLATASAAEMQLLQQLAKDPWGRFGGREGKLARIRAQEQAEAERARALLGLPLAAAGGRSDSPGCRAPAAAAGGKCGKRAREGAPAAGNAPTGAGDSGSKRRKCAASAGGKGATGAAEQEVGEGSAAAGARGSGAATTSAAAAVAAGAAAVSGPAKRKPKVYVVNLPQADTSAVPFTPTPASGWWGSVMFASAGRLEGLDQEVAVEPECGKGGAGGEAGGGKRGREEFNEGDQEALYMKVHGAQRQGRHGLGKSDKVKIAGGPWAGKRVTFGDDDGEGEGGEGGDGGGGGGEARAAADGGGGCGSNGAAAAGAGANDGAAGRKAAKRRLREAAGRKEPGGSEEVVVADNEAGTSSAPEAAGGVGGGGKTPKWSKLAARHLKGVAERRAKWKVLWRALWAEAGTAGGGRRARDAAKEQCWQQLQGSRRLVVYGRVVALA